MYLCFLRLIDYLFNHFPTSSCYHHIILFLFAFFLSVMRSFIRLLLDGLDCNYKENYFGAISWLVLVAFYLGVMRQFIMVHSDVLDGRVLRL